MTEGYYSFNRYLREKFGQRVQRISIDAGFNCPNLDGTLSDQGCIYCNNKGFSRYAGSSKAIEEQIKESIKYYQQSRKANKFIVYFQAFSNTYADREVLRQKYDLIKKFPEIVGLFISTRPDCVDEEKIELISAYRKDYLVWIEYGLQTTHNHILSSINRNHTYEDFLSACSLSRKYNINIGVHLILGLPSLSYEEMMLDAQRLAGLDIQGIKFHLLHVLRDTKLEKLYQNNSLSFLTEDEYVNIICDFLERIPSSFVILRLISDAHPDYLISPLGMSNKQRVLTRIKKELQKRNSSQGARYESISSAN